MRFIPHMSLPFLIHIIPLSFSSYRRYIVCLCKLSNNFCNTIDKPFQTLKPENLTWEKVISADYIVNYELLSAEMTSSEARLKTLSNKVRFVLFCPVLL